MKTPVVLGGGLCGLPRTNKKLSHRKRRGTYRLFLGHLRDLKFEMLMHMYDHVQILGNPSEVPHILP